MYNKFRCDIFRKIILQYQDVSLRTGSRCEGFNPFILREQVILHFCKYLNNKVLEIDKFKWKYYLCFLPQSFLEYCPNIIKFGKFCLKLWNHMCAPDVNGLRNTIHNIMSCLWWYLLSCSSRPGCDVRYRHAQFHDRFTINLLIELHCSEKRHIWISKRIWNESNV